LLSSGANIGLLFKKVGYLVTSAVIALPRMKKHFNEKRFNHTAASYMQGDTITGKTMNTNNLKRGIIA
jgi:hypothetical protein